MKLNNKGWGFRDMLVYSGILLFFFILATIYISTLYNDINNDISNNVSGSTTVEEDNSYVEDDGIVEDEIEIDYSYYHSKEVDMEKAVYTYLLNNNIIIVSDIINISLDELVEQGYIDPINDYVTNEKCIGYVNVIGEGTDYDIREYLKCSNYTTEGY